jgi:hypothetical protein
LTQLCSSGKVWVCNSSKKYILSAECGRISCRTMHLSLHADCPTGLQANWCADFCAIAAPS